ncbi:RNA polymerase factor sigma-54 [Helicobacter cappadocius]|uniref:RNA polymerase factor sigma-54 n=1 Tax=Helicobacter cappadocius TaxID=3063998 RepID=A0AA90PLV0_9HELI|nr:MULTISPECIES: RNA polymerase factor sigma-54 [unclassified Helicobacter]MDO7253616.1 RNA polymerase factor sigma-54 [Helicobacter sp. faydin-H75]MDP2539544.1 RNA polymerase factor sigma-54 [Helicobacter sp. faydin-H76]
MAQGARLRQNVAVKSKLSTTLKSWLPILQSNVLEMEETIAEYARENPYVSIKSRIVEDFSSKLKSPYPNTPAKNSMSDKIESMTILEQSLYEILNEQIVPPLFPTEISVKIAQDIIDNINEEGYFEAEESEQANELGVSTEQYRKVRERFAYLEPKGVGSKNVIESFLFQLEDRKDIKDSTYELCVKIITDLNNHKNYSSHIEYPEAMKVIRAFKNPPALAFAQQESFIIPDILIQQIDGEIQVMLNDDYYPSVNIDTIAMKSSNAQQYLKTKLKEARDLIDALDMRKQTIRKIGLMIVEYQYDFFMGGEMKPMRLKDIADEFGHSPSTISRAISNKYLECSRGVLPIKSFFTTAIDGDTSNASIKDFIGEIIKNENHKKPLSDLKILQMIEEKFQLKMVRRTITKYRKQLNIGSSSERKKIYEMSVL